MSVKSVSDLKVKAIELEQKHRIVPKVMGAAAALSVSAIPASAADGSTGANGTVDYSSIVDSLKSGLVEVVNNCIQLSTALIPLMAGVWGLSVMVGYAKKWFHKISG